MSLPIPTNSSRAQASRAAIQRIYIAMRHLFIRGSYKPLGVSGETLIQSLRVLSPEIYGVINDEERVELDGLLYVMNRLPKGIEECRHITLITREGYENSNFTPIIPAKRRRHSYRIDKDQMLIEMTRGRSDIYDILTHLTFFYIEAEKIRKNSLDSKANHKREWLMLEKTVELASSEEALDQEVAYSYLSAILGRTYQETVDASKKFDHASEVNNIFRLVYWMGKLSYEEYSLGTDREIFFSSALREQSGQHYHGEIWANQIKHFLAQQNWINRPLHIISANLHSVKNTLYAPLALAHQNNGNNFEELAKLLSQTENQHHQDKVDQYAQKHGLHFIDDHSGMNIDVQIIDLNEWQKVAESSSLDIQEAVLQSQPLIVVIDYAFGEQAYEVMDELLKPFEDEQRKTPLQVETISIMGKAGVLQGKKGDIMIPQAHVFEGTADNYPFTNGFKRSDFEGYGLEVYSDGPMITVLGTSLQNKDILRYFCRSLLECHRIRNGGCSLPKSHSGCC